MRDFIGILGVTAGTLQPAKAAVLLRLALTRTRDTEELIRIFDTY